MQEVLLYSAIYDFTAADFIRQMEAAKNSDTTVRMNTNGGSPEATFGMIAKLAERKSKGTYKTHIKVDGKAHSMGLFFLAYADDVEALDVSEGVLHRAAYPSWIEQDPEIMTDEMWANLDRVNAKLRAALESKVDPMKFAAMKGKTLDEVFSNSSRIDVVLTAQNMKDLGLVDRIVSITPEKKSELGRVYAMAASTGVQIEPLAALKEPTTTTQTTTKNSIMNLAELKAQYPAVYAEAVNAGVTQERNRVEAHMEFADLDLEAVKKGIAEGKDLTPKDMAAFSRKAMGAGIIAAATEGNASNLTTTQVAAQTTAAEKEEEAFFAQVDGRLGLKK